MPFVGCYSIGILCRALLEPSSDECSVCSSSSCDLHCTSLISTHNKLLSYCNFCAHSHKCLRVFTSLTASMQPLPASYIPCIWLLSVVLHTDKSNKVVSTIRVHTTGAAANCSSEVQAQQKRHCVLNQVCALLQGTRDYNLGDGADVSVQAAAQQMGLQLPEKFQARQINPERDIVCFDVVLVMDKFTAADVLREVGIRPLTSVHILHIAYTGAVCCLVARRVCWCFSMQVKTCYICRQ